MNLRSNRKALPIGRAFFLLELADKLLNGLWATSFELIGSESPNGADLCQPRVERREYNERRATLGNEQHVGRESQRGGPNQRIGWRTSSLSAAVNNVNDNFG